MHAQSLVFDLAEDRSDFSAVELEFKSIGFEPNLIFAFYACQIDAEALRQTVLNAFPNAVLIGGSSAGGVVGADFSSHQHAIGFLLIEDAAGEYGVGIAALGDDASAAAEQALNDALANSGNQGELPELIWIYQAPGQEEAVISGLRRVVGDRCPIVGGSAADEDVSGQWSQISSLSTMTTGVVVCTLFPSAQIGHAFQGGYEPNGHTGRVTRIDGGRVTRVDGDVRSRVILEIDNQPAARVYNSWTGGAISQSLDHGGSVLAATNMRPLSVLAGRNNGVEQYLLVHPQTVRQDGALTTFAEVAEGCEVYCMQGDPDQLIMRAGRVARQAKLHIAQSQPLAALVVFCGGCRLALKERMGDISTNLHDQLGDVPVLTCFTFGEQGPMLGQNKHGNLMISTIVMGS